MSSPMGLRFFALSIAALGIAAFGIATAAWAVDSTPPFPDPAMQQRYLDMTHEFRCVQCQNETLADSNVGLAGDLRLEVHDLMLQGKSDEEIRSYMVARYGEFILFKPRMNWHNAWLWGAPGILLLAGLVVAIRVMRNRARLPITDEDAAETLPKA